MARIQKVQLHVPKKGKKRKNSLSLPLPPPHPTFEKHLHFHKMEDLGNFLISSGNLPILVSEAVLKEK